MVNKKSSNQLYCLLNQYYPIIITLIFLILALYNIKHHEMWRDEMQAWTMTRNNGLIELYYAVKYEAQSGLWNYLIFPLTRITDNAAVMQIFHVFLASLTIYLFNRYAPFNIFLKFLFSFGYFAFFEYATISRQYVLGTLLIILFCILAKKYKKNYLFISFILFFLSLTSIYGLIAALMLDIYFLWSLFGDKLAAIKKELISLLIVILGTVISVFLLIAPKDMGFAQNWYFGLDTNRLAESISIFYNALAPIPKDQMMFWNTNILESHLLIRLILSVLIFILVVLMLARNKKAAFVFAGGTIAIIALTYFKYFGSLRHWGYILYLLIAAFWLASYSPPQRLRIRWFNTLSSKLFSLSNVFLGLVLTIQFACGVLANYLDYKQPFSESEETAKYIKDIGYSGYFIIGDEDYTITPIAGYLDKSIYYPTSHTFSSYVVWNNKREPLHREEVVKEAKTLKDEGNDNVLILLNYPLEDDLVNIYELKYIAGFNRAIIYNENYYLYAFDAGQNKT